MLLNVPQCTGPLPHSELSCRSVSALVERPGYGQTTQVGTPAVLLSCPQDLGQALPLPEPQTPHL